MARRPQGQQMPLVQAQYGQQMPVAQAQYGGSRQSGNAADIELGNYASGISAGLDYSPPSGPGGASTQVHSTCIQLAIGDQNDALAVFRQSGTDNNGRIPLVLVPSPRSWFSVSLTIPTGCFCLQQRFGESKGVATPGLMFKPAFFRIAYVVTQQACTYNAPVKKCPTKDNVRVDVDLVVVFMIRDAEAFVYKLGAGHFNDLLAGAIQEGMRVLVREQMYDTIFSLRGSRCDTMITKLNKKFMDVGVVFQNVTITSVHLPDSLRKSLESKTKMNKLMEKVVREHEFELGEMRRKSEMEIQTLKREQERLIVAEQGKLRRAELNRQEGLGKADEDRRVAIIQAEEKTKVESMESKAELMRTRTGIEQYKLETISKAKAEAEAVKVKAEVDKNMMLTQATGEASDIMAKAKGIEFQSVTEAANTEHLKHSRAHALDMQEKQVLGELAQSGKGGMDPSLSGIISMDKDRSANGGYSLLGAHGDSLIGALTSGTLSVPGSASGGQR